MKPSELSATAKDFVPRQAEGGMPYVPEPDSIQGAAERLWSSPEEFFQIASDLVKLLDRTITNETSFTSAIDELFIQCVGLENFQNSGARLCAYLCNHFTTDFGGIFRTHLLMRCQREYNARHALVSSEDGQKQLVGFTLFMAELMMQLGETAVTQVLSEKVLQLVLMLIDCQSELSVKWAVNVLKLSGCILDRTQPDLMLAVINKIKDLIVSSQSFGQLSRGVRYGLLNILELRASRWGVDESVEQPQYSSHNPYINMQATGTAELAYDASGNAIYYEEDIFVSEPLPGDFASFPQEGFANYSANGDVYNAGQQNLVDGFGCGDFQEGFDKLQSGIESLEVVYDGSQEFLVEREDMDPEMMEAYEKFIREKDSNRKT